MKLLKTFILCLLYVIIVPAQSIYDTYDGFTVPVTPVLPPAEIHPSLWFKTADIPALKNKKNADSLAAAVWSRVQSTINGFRSQTPSSMDFNDRPRMAKSLAFDWILNGDTASRRKAIECLLTAYNNVPRTATTANFDGDYDEIYRATWLQNYCTAYDWVYSELTHQQDSTIRNNLIVETLLLRNNMIGGVKYATRPHNHKSKPAWGIVTAALTLSSDSRAADWLQFGLTQANTVTKYQFSADGIYREGSHYFIYSAVNFIPYLWHYKNVSGVDHFQYYRPAFEMPVRIRNSKGWIPNIEDSYEKPVPTHMVAAAYKNTQTFLHPAEPLSKILQWNWFNTNFFTAGYTGATNDVVWEIDEYITYDPSIERIAPVGTGIQKTNSGIMVFRDSSELRSKPSRYLLFHGVAECDNHQHPDLLSYIIEYNGTILATDAGYGKDGYSDAKRDWYIAPYAHNMVTIDSDGPLDLSTNVRPSDTHFLTSPFYDLAEKYAKTNLSDGNISRGIAFIEKNYWVVYDIPSSSYSVAYKLYLHSRGTMNLNNNQATWTTGSDTYGSAQRLHFYVATSGTRTITAQSGWTSLFKDEIAQDYIEVAQTGVNPSFMHLLQPGSAASSAPQVSELSKNGIAAFKLQSESSNLFMTSLNNTSHTIDSISTDANFCWVKYDSLNVKRFALTNGKTLDFRGKKIFSGDKSVTFCSDYSSAVQNSLLFDTIATATVIQFLTSFTLNSSVKVYFNLQPVTYSVTNGKIQVTLIGAGELKITRQPNSIEEGFLNQKKTGFKIIGNYPNPFNPSTVIRFSLPAAGNISLKIYNMLGEVVTTLIQNRNYKDGIHEVRFYAEELPAGIYISRLEYNEKTSTQKFVLLK